MGGGGGGGAAAAEAVGGLMVDGDDAAGSDVVSLPPALEIIILGSGGGPLESNVTAFLVRSIATGWGKGSIVAVDGGVQLSAIVKILEDTLPSDLGKTEELALPYVLTSGPFAGLEVPYATANANAAHIHRNLVDTYLVTHPHLDHISGFVINTAGLPNSRPKRLAGLPSTIAAIKTHIFNNVIWPNLSDENNGAGLVTYMRLVEGGSPALGEGEGKGYLEISDGLAVKIWGVSHGHCIERHSHRGSGSSSVRHGSFDASSMSIGPMGVGMGGSLGGSLPLLSPRALAHHNSANPSIFVQQQQQHGGSQAGTMPILPNPTGSGRPSSITGGGHSTGESICVYDSSAYFIRDVVTGREVLMFGDVEPDSISLSPRNQQIWQEAAPKIAAGNLAAIFIECSFDDSQPIDSLFGHLTPRFIVEEMTALAAEVSNARLAFQHQQQTQHQQHLDGGSDKKKRKRENGDEDLIIRRKTNTTPTPSMSRRTTVTLPDGAGGGATSHPSTSQATQTDDPVSPRTIKPSRRVRSGSISDDPASSATGTPHIATPTAELSLRDVEFPSRATSRAPSRAATPAGSFSTPIPVVSAAAAAVAGVSNGARSHLHDLQISMPPTPTPMEVGLGAGIFQRQQLVRPLQGLKVVIIHVKEKMNDGPKPGDVILEQLRKHETEVQLGCEYFVSSAGQVFYF
ncbi:cAMP phosphodiesterases class-II-domain-containing protein [Podospora appendiculata]|uniref:cAMP phosphodiesterases class-II-domain-containing protein n=1 Tax=Podospora appendiculata TaxID=314037 RepID=A0AAE0X209_9PEZI|nr:cAMP phosphodiesterases class-II-domain-containing protein [Podospora appendiculata]